MGVCVCACESVRERKKWSDMQKVCVCVWFRPLNVGGDLLSGRDKGNCGVSVYGPALIASPTQGSHLRHSD